MELLEARRLYMLRYGDLPPVTNTVYGVGFGRQLCLVLGRQLTLNLRDGQGVTSDLLVSIAKAVVVGCAYWNIGKLNAEQQVGFYFMVCTTCSIDGLKQMPKTIAERTIVKMETSEALYSEWAYIISFTLVSGVQGLIANSLFIVILFWMSGLAWQLFESVYLWTTLLYFTMDALYLMVAAIAKDSSMSFVLSLPFMMLFLLYNGFLTTRKTVPGFMLWAIDSSPVAYTMEEMTVTAQNFYGGTEKGKGYDMVVENNGYVEQPGRAIAVIICLMVTFRIIQVVCLKLLNNIQR